MPEQVDGDGRDPYLNDAIADPNFLLGIPYGFEMDLNSWACNGVATQDIGSVEVDEQYMY